MKTPEFICRQESPWEEWLGTMKTYKGDAFAISTHTRGVMYPISEVETLYPGFTQAYEHLTAIGCKSHCRTIVLKFCILHADGLDLDSFLVNSKTLSKVESALTLGLSNPELENLLFSNGGSDQSAGLPNDLEFVVHA